MNFNLKKLLELLNKYYNFRFENMNEIYHFSTDDGKNIIITIAGKLLNINNIDLKNDSSNGIGVKIISEIIDFAKGEGIETILIIEVNNFSRSACEKLGFLKEEGTNNMVLRF